MAHLPRQSHTHTLAHWREDVMRLSEYILFRMLSFQCQTTDVSGAECLAVLKMRPDEPVKTLMAIFQFQTIVEDI